MGRGWGAEWDGWMDGWLTRLRSEKAAPMEG